MKHFNAFLNKIFEFSFLFLVIYLKVSQFEHLTRPKLRAHGKTLYSFGQTQRDTVGKHRINDYYILPADNIALAPTYCPGAVSRHPC